VTTIDAAPYREQPQGSLSSRRTILGNVFKPPARQLPSRTATLQQLAESATPLMLPRGVNGFPFASLAAGAPDGFDPRALRASLHKAPVLAFTPAEMDAGEWGICRRALAPCDANAKPFDLSHLVLTWPASFGSGAMLSGQFADPVSQRVATCATELRTKLHDGSGSDKPSYDGIVDGEAAWAVMPLDVLGDGEEPALSPAEWAAGLREGCDLNTFYDGVMEGEVSWRLVLPDDVIKLDTPTPEQEALLAARTARAGEFSDASRQRRLRKLERHFATRGANTWGGAPPAAFFASCLKVATAAEQPAKLAKHAAMEAEYAEVLQQQGSWLTVWPDARRWPTDGSGSWAERHGVCFGPSGFAFASAAAMRQFMRRMERREATRDMARRHRAAAATAAIAAAATKLQPLPTLKTARGVVAEFKSLGKPPQIVNEVKTAVLVLLDTMSPAKMLKAMASFDAASTEGKAALERARPLLQDDSLAPSMLRTKSSAAAALASWVRAVADGTQQRLLAPRRVARIVVRVSKPIKKAQAGGREWSSPPSPSSVVCVDTALVAVDMKSISEVVYSCEKLLEKAVVGRFADSRAGRA